MLDEIRAEAYKCKSVDKSPKMIVIDDGYDEELMKKMKSETKPETKTDISPILRKIDRMKREIKKN
jgi:hypothetical protein